MLPTLIALSVKVLLIARNSCLSVKRSNFVLHTRQLSPGDGETNCKEINQGERRAFLGVLGQFDTKCNAEY